MNKKFKRKVKNPLTGRCLDLYVLNKIYERIQERITSLPFTALPLSGICGKDYWSELDEWEKNEAGFCMSYLVLAKKVAMVAVGMDCHFALIYMRIPNDQRGLNTAVSKVSGLLPS